MKVSNRCPLHNVAMPDSDSTYLYKLYRIAILYKLYLQLSLVLYQPSGYTVQLLIVISCIIPAHWLCYKINYNYFLYYTSPVAIYSYL